VKEYVGGIVNKLKLSNLRNVHRNKTFKRTAQFVHDDKDFVICQSDDVLMVMDCEKCKWTLWCVIQQSKCMLQDERVWLTRLQAGRPVDRGRRLLVTKAEDDLTILMELIRFYLG
jgi:hypothetical protein